MNYYEHHLGDYAEATAHLSFIEDAAYSRLIRKYYATEKPLPPDVKAVQRLIGAREDAEREAVSIVLEEFFVLMDDGWHNRRCDEEISRYMEGDAERKQKADHEKERMLRHREERSRLFAELRDRGITPKWDTTVTQLREIFEQLTCNAPATRTGTDHERTCNAPATRTGTDHERTCNAPATANQTPDTRSQYKKQGGEIARGSNSPACERARGSPAGEICSRIKTEVGFTGVNPSHPDLLAAMEAGITADEIVDAAHDAKARGKGFAYAIATAKGRRMDAASNRATIPNARASPHKEKFDPVAFVNQGRKTAASGAGGGNDGFIDGESQRVA